MKKRSSELRPRLVCRIVRWTRPELPAGASWSSRHVAECPSCQRFYQAAESVDRDLVATAPPEAPQVPEGLEDRIWSAVQTDQNLRKAGASAEKRRSVTSWRWALAAVALVGVAIFGFRPTAEVASSPTVAQQDFDQQDLETLVAQIQNVSADWLVLADTETPTSLDNQLAEEWGALEADASAALRFLKLSFVPSDESAS